MLNITCAITALIAHKRENEISFRLQSCEGCSRVRAGSRSLTTMRLRNDFRKTNLLTQITQRRLLDK